MRRGIPVIILVLVAACGGSSTTSTPATPTTPTTTTLAAPVPASPGADEQLSSLRPTLTVTNSTSSGAGARTYDFQISDRSDFAAGSGTQSPYFTLTVTQNGVGEGSGATSLAVPTDMVPAARFYWRARVNQGSLTSDWSPVRSFRTQIVGYTRPGELYDPLVNGQTVAEILFKRTSFISGKGLRINDSDSYARYRLNPPLTGGGEFSVDVEGLTDKLFPRTPTRPS